MQMRVFLVVLALLAGGIHPALAGSHDHPGSIEAAREEIWRLPWDSAPGVYQLTGSNSSVRLPDGFDLLRDDAARRFMFLNQGGAEFPDVEAVYVRTEPYTQFILSYIESGFVVLDDWKEVDTAAILREIRKATEIGNVQRRKHGFPELRITEWVVEPTLDRDRKAVYWAFELIEDGISIINAVSLKLGRRGFERIIWIGTRQQYDAAFGLIDSMLEAHNFDTGFRFADYVSGDDVAPFGIAALVTLTATGQRVAGKAGIAALIVGLLALGKKFIVVPILLALGGLWALVRRFFGTAET